MAGLFGGFFNYDKEGPGVEKNAPKKNGFIVFFEIYFKNFWKLTISSVWFLLLSAPVVTMGLAAAGFTNVVRNMALDRHSFGTSDFFSTIKKNWKQALPAGIINAVIFFILIGDILFFYNATQGVGMLLGIAVVITVLLLFIMMQFYMWTILITFKLNLKQIYINSFKFALIGLKRNFLVILLSLLVYAAIFVLFLVGKNIIALVATLIVVFALPGFQFLLIQFNIFENIKKYMIIPYYNDHPDEDIDLRRSLGIYEEENEAEIIEDLM